MMGERVGAGAAARNLKGNRSRQRVVGMIDFCPDSGQRSRRGGEGS